MKLAVDMLIKTYQSLPQEVIDKEGVKAIGKK